MSRLQWDRRFTFVLSWMYVFLGLAVMVQLARIIYWRHRIISFQGAFLSICFFWTLFRILFWFVVDLDSWPDWLSDFIYVLPTVCECATFSLLLLFYAKMADPKMWSLQRLDFGMAYVMANLLMLVLTVLFAGITSRARHGNSTAESSRTYVDKVFFFSSGMYFGALVVCATYYVAKLVRRVNNPLVRRSKKTIIVTSLVFVVFLSRCVFDFVSAYGGIHSMHVFESSWYSDSKEYGSGKLLPYPACFLFLLWECVPTLTVLVYFRHIPVTRISLNMHWCNILCSCSCWGEPPAGLVQDATGSDGRDELFYQPEMLSDPELSPEDARGYGAFADGTSYFADSPIAIRVSNVPPPQQNLFDDPHRYSLTSTGASSWRHSFLSAQSRGGAAGGAQGFQNAYASVSSHYDMTPQRYSNAGPSSPTY